MVAQEFRSKGGDGLFAATPPLESLRALVAILASKSFDDNGKFLAQNGAKRYGMMVVDIKRAHFYAAAQRKLFFALPPEDDRYGEADLCGELLQSLYGTRDASSNWEQEYTRTLTRGGFQSGAASPCHFCHWQWDVRLLVHGDDFVAVGPMDGLNNFKDVMTSSYECKSDLIGMGVHDDKELRVLGRMISLREFGVTYEPDIRHVEAVLRDLGLEGANPVGTLGEKEKFEAGLSREVR